MMTTPKASVVDGCRLVMEACPYCGAANVIASPHYRRCARCTARFIRYKELQKDHSPAATVELAKILNEYKELKKAGYKVPSDFPA